MLKNIYEKYKDLSDNEKQVINYILGYENIVNLKLKHITQSLFLSSSTVIRACKKLGFSSFNEFKFSLISNNDKKNKNINESLGEIKNRIKGDLSKTLELLTDEKLEKFVKIIIESKRIYCLGYGNSSMVAKELSRNLQLAGFWALAPEEKYLIERIVEISGENDLIIIVSLSGENEILNSQLLESKKNNVKIASITSYGGNNLEKLSDVCLYTYSSSSKREKIRSRLMLHIASNLVFEKLLLDLENIK
ncbi:MurR/RpiR family transcriptional regulator [Oceanivirga salmonicida]|uniref:MurR/RpiR family transcriptional regulator n=1 Tax=Oceanivirga salmonicida TaxID=1769291 RepID=UPI00082B3B03|nr:MurR/RpiR family transcriptional regulator [Oceanivirga salmonicida]